MWIRPEYSPLRQRREDILDCFAVRQSGLHLIILCHNLSPVAVAGYVHKVGLAMNKHESFCQFTDPPPAEIAQWLSKVALPPDAEKS